MRNNPENYPQLFDHKEVRRKGKCRRFFGFFVCVWMASYPHCAKGEECGNNMRVGQMLE